jgi:hypothetical protein
MTPADFALADLLTGSSDARNRQLEFARMTAAASAAKAELAGDPALARRWRWVLDALVTIDFALNNPVPTPKE